MILLDKLKPYILLLGSKSPRRKQLLEGAGFTFTVLPPIHYAEDYPSHLTDKEVAEFLAKHKADIYSHYITNDKTILITADTIVSLNSKVLGKPNNKTEAITMLQQLSGNIHIVYTGVCIKTSQRQVSFTAATEVQFRKLKKEEIQYYVEQYRPYDKAGSYGAQEWIGFVGIEHIRGSYFNVMGLPIQKLYVELDKFLQ